MGPVNSSSRAKAAEEAGERYDRWNQEEGLFHFQYIYETNRGGGSEDGVETQSPKSDAAGSIFPVRGLGAVMVFILSLYGGVMAGEDERRGLFMPLGIGLRLPVVWQLQQRRSLGLFICFLCAFSGRHGRGRSFGAVGRELGLLLLYGCGCTVFAFGLKLIVRSPELLCCMIPFFIIGSLLFCPVFVDPGRWIPGMEQLGRLFLPYYYLRCF